MTEDIQEIWVSTTEAGEITGYHPRYLQQLVRNIYKQPEADRLVKLRYRSRRYEIWLPDLIKYVKEYGYGSHKLSQQNP